MLLRAIHPQPIRRNFKLARRKPERHKRQNPDKNPNRIPRKTLKRADIHSLGAVKRVSSSHTQNPAPAENDVLVPQPISKINPLDHNRRPLVTFNKGDGLEHIFDITMAPVLALDGGDGSDVCIISTAIMDLSQVNTYCQRQKHGPARGGRPARGPE